MTTSRQHTQLLFVASLKWGKTNTAACWTCWACISPVSCHPSCVELSQAVPWHQVWQGAAALTLLTSQSWHQLSARTHQLISATWHSHQESIIHYWLCSRSQEAGGEDQRVQPQDSGVQRQGHLRGVQRGEGVHLWQAASEDCWHRHGNNFSSTIFELSEAIVSVFLSCSPSSPSSSVWSRVARNISWITLTDFSEMPTEELKVSVIASDNRRGNHRRNSIILFSYDTELFCNGCGPWQQCWTPAE